MSSKIVFLLLLVVAIVSCKENKKRTEAAQIVAEWMGKEIRFPDDYQCSFSGSDTISTICADLFQSEYKVLLYVDSTGCSSCKLKLTEWRQVVADSDTLFGRKLSFLLFFQPKNKKAMDFLFKRDRFDYPVFIDMNNRINQLNHFSSVQSYQCFLLDKDNKVLMIGNPVLNPKIWELFKKQISGNETTQQEKQTSVEVDKSVHDFGNIPLGESHKVVFQLKNTGDFPLIINHVSTSCGCTAVEWEKQNVESGKTANIKVEITLEETGYFNKTIKVYGNIKKGAVSLTMKGMAEQ